MWYVYIVNIKIVSIAQCRDFKTEINILMTPMYIMQSL